LFLVQSYGVPGGEGWNAPTWTLSALLGCYLCLPVLSRIGHRLSPWSALIGSIAILLAANLATQAWLGLPVYEMPLRFGFLRALPLFVLGVGVAIFASRVYVRPRFAGWLGVGALLLLVVAQTLGHFALLSLGLMTVIIIAAGATPVRQPSKLIEHLALMSFSIFLTNEVVRIVWFGFFDVAGQTCSTDQARSG
jgi:peptidoglycan/LPS O-acetylase OafA/YrhL